MSIFEIYHDFFININEIKQINFYNTETFKIISTCSIKCRDNLKI